MPMGEGSHRTMEKRIAVIGSGNVATHLATAVEGVVQICSPNLANAAALAEKVGCDATNSPSGLADADIYIVAVKDDAIAAVLESVPTRCRKALWMHTSGSVGKSVFDGLGYDRYGVFYPLQTFSKSVDLDMSRVPFFIEGSDKRTTDEIRQLALSVSTTVYIADSHLRQQMHVAAVFACNFSNYMYTLADWIKDNAACSDYVIPYAMGADDPLPNTPNNSVDNREKNRRLEIYLVPGKSMIRKSSRGQLR